MTKKISIIILFFFSSVNVFASETIGIITTIKPIDSLVSAVVGDTGKTIPLIPSETSPHEFRLKPSDARALQNGNIIFYISPHLETSIVKVFETLPKNIKIINLMEETGIEHLSIRDNEAWELHDHHEDEKHDDHDKHAQKDEHDDHKSKDDVHIWLDPENAIKIIKKVNTELSFFFPENAEIYDENATKIINKIKS
jgi:zinc transport system substrate-binding protein